MVEKIVAFATIIIAAGLCVAFLVAIVNQEPQPKCVRWIEEKQVIYPNMGLLALGPSYTGLAVVPVEIESRRCVEREAK